MIKIDQLKYDVNGLIPAVIQESGNETVLMVAYMNRESLEITLSERRTCFYSRSRQTLWRKGETSGYIQKVKEIWADCDMDTLTAIYSYIFGVEAWAILHPNKPAIIEISKAE